MSICVYPKTLNPYAPLTPALSFFRSPSQVRGRLSALMPESSWGIATRAVPVPLPPGADYSRYHPFLPPPASTTATATSAPGAAAKSGGQRAAAAAAAAASAATLTAEVQWKERFLVRLPEALCEALVTKGRTAAARDPQFLGTPLEVSG